MNFLRLFKAYSLSKIHIWSGFLLGLTLSACTEPTITSKEYNIETVPILSFPAMANADCHENERARIYDLCADQTTLFETALKTANENEKTLLVSYGAEWCIWCHVFKAYIAGDALSFEYTYGEPGYPEKWTDRMVERGAPDDLIEQAYLLNQFVAENFVVVHIDYEFAPGGDDVLINNGAAEHYDNWLPYIFSVTKDGEFAAALESSEVEVRRDVFNYFRGYDRLALKDKLDSMKRIAEKMSGT